MPKFFAVYIKIITAVNRALFFAAAALMGLIVPVMLYEVTSRYIFNAPTVWSLELALLMFGPYFLFGGPYLLHLKGHVSLDVLTARVSPQTRRFLEIFNQLIIIIFCVILFSYAWPLAIQSFEFRETSFSAWNPTIWHVKFSVPIAVALLGAQSIAELLVLVFNPEQAQESVTV